MKCPHCQTEQGDQNFCSDCGKRLELGQPATVGSEYDEQTENAAETISLNEPMKESADQHHADSLYVWGIVKQMILRRSFMVPFVSFASVLLAAAGLTLWLGSSEFVQEWYVQLYKSYGFDESIAVLFAVEAHSLSWWHTLAHMHAAALETMWFRSTGDRMLQDMEFSIRLPFIGLLLATFVLLVLVQKTAGRIKGREGGSRSQRVATLLIQALLYGLLVSTVLWGVDPSQSWEKPSPLSIYENHLTINFLAVAGQAAVVYGFAAGLASLSLRRRIRDIFALRRQAAGSVEEDLAGTFKQGIRMLAQWLLLLCAALFAIGLLVPLVWAVSNPVSLYQQPPMSWVHLWREYGHDPLWISAQPAYWLQDWLFATGGSLQLEGHLLARLTGLQPMQLQLVTGLRLDMEGAVASEGLQQLASAARKAWHVYALLLATIYITAKVAVHRSWKQIAVFAAGIGIIGAVAAYISALGIRLPEEMGVQRLGFDPIASGIHMAVLGLLSAGIGKLKWFRSRNRSEVKPDAT